MLEPDPESSSHLFVLDEEQRITKIEDTVDETGLKTQSEGKAVIVSTIDMSEHTLEEEIQNLEQRSWTSVIITDRILKIGEYNLSTRS